MAESIVTLFVDKLSFLIAEEANLLLGAKEKLMSLRDELEWIRHFLRDAEKKRRKLQLVEFWVNQIRDLAYDAEDVIDVYMIHAEQKRYRSSFSKFIHGPKHLRTLRRLGKQIEQINARARKISAYKSDYNLQVLEMAQDSGHGNTEDMVARRRSMVIVQEHDVVGFQKEYAQVKRWLRDKDRQSHALSIIGMGGLGKTTLARMVYNNSNVSRDFDVQAWISVSQEYRIRDILLRVLKQVMITADAEYHSRLEKMDSGVLGEELRKQLDSKRYLLVIDDIWKVEDWEQISGCFPKNSAGSKILLTTRNKEVALCADPLSNNHLELRLLTEEESWELFCKRVFSMSGGRCPPELTKLGKEIADKCRGLPLGIIVIVGILMRKERSPDTWSKVLDSANWQLSQEASECREVLILSYLDLPYYLKPCFLYLGLFPEDSEISAKKLILLWVAEGFVQAKGDEKMEDIAEDWLEELIQRSMIQVIDRKYHGGSADTVRIHDLLRDLALTEARKDGFMDIFTENGHSTSTGRSRRYAIHPSTVNEMTEQFLTVASRNLRSLLLFENSFDIGMWISTPGDGKKMIRVLELEGAVTKEGLPQEIGALLFLQYLGLRDTQIRGLPTSIGNLLKLQTLDVRGTCIEIFPKMIWKLRNIRHLYLDTSYCKTYQKVDDATMKMFCRNLLTLSVNGDIWAPRTGSGFAEYFTKQGSLQSLEIKEYRYSFEHCLPLNLTELFLYESKLEQHELRILGGLPELKVLWLSGGLYAEKVLFFYSGDFHKLQFLNINGLTGLTNIMVKDGALSNLRHLRIKKCVSFDNAVYGWWKNISTLQKIELDASFID
ncbi:hypothetical protein ACHQM5_006495 [Ranunculus cassubicifolius]